MILEQIAEAYISLLDRWEMTVENKKGKVKEAKAFTNYLGVGVDAQAALQVHMVSNVT
jgi:diacylglycerol kinase (ATP)